MRHNKLQNKTGNLRISRNIEARSRNHCCIGKAIIFTYSECVFVALVMQDAKRMRPITLSRGLSGSTIFFTLSHKGHDFRKKKH